MHTQTHARTHAHTHRKRARLHCAAVRAWQAEHRGRAGAHVIRGALIYLM